MTPIHHTGRNQKHRRSIRHNALAGHANINRNTKISPRIVVDANVLVTATRNRDWPSFALIQLVRTRSVLICCSPALFLEYEDVLRRPEQRAVSGLRIKDVDAILNELAALLEPVLTHYQWRPQLRDPADEMVLEAAANARVDALVTYNLRDFLPAERFGISVLAPEQTFERFDLATKRN